MLGKLSAQNDDSMEDLEAAVAKELHSLFEHGVFDSLGRLMTDALRNSKPMPSKALHLAFGLKYLDIREDGKSRKRIRALGHLAVVAEKSARSTMPKIRFGISPAFIDDVKPCPSCVGTGVSWDEAKTAHPVSLRPFGVTFRKL